MPGTATPRELAWYGLIRPSCSLESRGGEGRLGGVGEAIDVARDRAEAAKAER